MYILINIIAIFQIIQENNYKYHIKYYYAFLFNLNNINYILFIFFRCNSTYNSLYINSIN